MLQPVASTYESDRTLDGEDQLVSGLMSDMTYFGVGWRIVPFMGELYGV